MRTIDKLPSRFESVQTISTDITRAELRVTELCFQCCLHLRTESLLIDDTSTESIPTHNMRYVHSPHLFLLNFAHILENIMLSSKSLKASFNDLAHLPDQLFTL